MEIGMKFKVFILDVDGVMTTGHFLYSESGKIMKIFGPDDNDGLGLLNQYMQIRFVTGDRKGFAISNKRIKEDMKFDLDLVIAFLIPFQLALDCLWIFYDNAPAEEDEGDK